MGRWQDMLWHSDPWCGHQLSQHSTLCQGPCINGVTEYNPACRLCNMSDMKEGVKNFCFKQLLLFDPHMHSNCHKAVIIKGSFLYRPLHTTHVVWEPEPGGQHRSVGPGPWRRWPVGVTLHGVTAHMWHFVTVTQTCSPCLTYTIILGECWMCHLAISHFDNLKYAKSALTRRYLKGTSSSRQQLARLLLRMLHSPFQTSFLSCDMHGVTVQQPDLGNTLPKVH